MRYGKFPGGKWLSPQSTCTSVLDKISAAVERTLALKSWYLMLISEKRSLSVLWIINRTGILQLHRFRLLKEHTSTNSLSKELLVLLTRNSSYLITLPFNRYLLFSSTKNTLSGIMPHYYLYAYKTKRNTYR